MKAADILPEGKNQIELNGVIIRKGSVGAFLVNARVWCDPTVDSAQRASAERDMIEVLPALSELGLFEVFSIRDAALRQWVDTH